MLSNYFRPLNILWVAFYVAFMCLALDSEVLSAVVLYMSEENKKPVYISGDVEVATVAGSKSGKKPIVAIQYKAKSISEVPESIAFTTKTVIRSKKRKNSKTGKRTDAITVAMASTVKAVIQSEVKEKHAKIKQKTKEELLAEALKKRNPRYKEPPSDATTPSALAYIDAISKNKWEYASLLDRYIVQFDPQTYIVLTIRPSLQRLTEGVLKKYSTRISTAIIQDPASGEIVAMTSSHRNQILDILSKKYKTENWALRPTFPVASIFKIITAAAGIDSKKITAKSKFLAWGKSYMTVWKAFATSHNGVYARIARKTGRAIVQKYAEAFGFNKPFFFDLPVNKSLAKLPSNASKMGQAAAGLNKNFLVSPIHVAQIISTVLNRGKMMKPYLVDYVVRKGEIIFRRKPFQLAQPIKFSTARDIYKMMYATTSVGTGKKGFGGYRRAPNLSKICGGKTGTLTGDSPNYLFTWFGGFTKAIGRDLCIVTLSGQSNHSGSKAASIAGQLAYELYMKRQEGNKQEQFARN